MANLYSRDIMIAATVYIVADTEEEARAEYDKLKDTGLDLPEDDGGELPIFGGTYDADMPEISLSPAMTIHGPFPDDVDGGFELVEEDLEGDEDEEEGDD